MAKAYADSSRLRDYRAVFGTDAGQRVLVDMMTLFGVFRSNFHHDAHVNAYRNGQRDVVLHIIHYMQMKPAELVEARLTAAEMIGEEATS